MLHSPQCRHAKMQNNMISMRKKRTQTNAGGYAACMLVCLFHEDTFALTSQSHHLCAALHAYDPIQVFLSNTKTPFFFLRQVPQPTGSSKIVTPLSMFNRKLLLLLSNYIFPYRYIKTPRALKLADG